MSEQVGRHLHSDFTFPSVSRVRWILPPLFFFSGACGLIYEIVWTRMLIVVFGTTVFAVTTVLSAFMGGMALGSFLFGRWVDRYGHPLRMYAYVEFGIGLFALIFPWLLSGLSGGYVALYRMAAGSFYVLSFLRFFLCFLLLLMPTTLMGATLPVISRAFVRGQQRLGWSIGGLYGINTFGAVVGCFGATFFSMAYLGVKESLYLAAALNLLIGGIALLLSYRVGRVAGCRLQVAGSRFQAQGPRPKAEGDEDTVPEEGRLPLSTSPLLPLEGMAGRRGIVLWSIALSGLAALGYEVVWMRLLGMVLQSNTAYAFGLMLMSFLIGLSVGSAVFGRWADRWRDLFLAFGSVEITIGLFGLFSVLLFGSLPRVMHVLSTSSWWGYVGGRFFASLTLMLIPTVLMGGVFPLAIRIYAQDMGQLGRGIGVLYSANTVGAILGALVVGFVLLPLFGTQGAIRGLAFVNLGVGAAILLVRSSRRRRLRWGVVGGTGLIALIALVGIPGNTMMHVYQQSEPGAELVYWDDGVTGTVTLHRFEDGGLLLKVNGGGEVPTDYASLQTFRMLGHLPLLLHPDPKDVLVIAFGGGIALGAVAQHAVERVDCVEIAASVVGSAAYFSSFNHGILDRIRQPDSNIHLIIDDGRNYVLTTDRRYDVITGDATHPGSSDSWVLYTKEFYALCRDRLNPGGILCQWLPMHGLSEGDYRMILHTFQMIFPHTTLWLFNEYTVLLGTLDPLQMDVGCLKERMEQPKVRDSLTEVGLGDPVALLSCFAMNSEMVGRFVEGSRVNTDDHPYISFSEPRRYAMAAGLPNLFNVARAMTRVFPLLTDMEEEVETLERRLDRRMEAKRYVIRGNIYRRGGMPLEAEAQYQEAMRIDPDERDARYFARQLQGQKDDAVVAGYVRMALTYEQSGRYKAAISAYERAITLDPRNVKVLSNLANLYYREGRVEEAIATLKRSVRIDSTFFGGYFNLGNLYNREKQYDHAIEAYKQALKITPNSAIALYNLGGVYEKDGRHNEAMRLYRSALKYVTDNSRLERALRKRMNRLRRRG